MRKYLIAKEKGKNEEYYHILSDKKIYNIDDNLSTIKYDANYKLEEDECFFVEDFSNKDYCIDLLTDTFNITGYKNLRNSELNSDCIKYICNIIDLGEEQNFYFQKINKSQILKKRLLKISGEPDVKDEEGILIKSNPDAIYKKREDRLYFQNISSLSTIFKGIEILYREATNEEVKVFLNKNFLKCEGGFNFQKVNKANRKKIALLGDKYDNLKNEDFKEVINYAEEFSVDLTMDKNNNIFTIHNDKDLTKVLSVLGENFYETKLTNEKRVSNSHRKLM